MAVHPSNYVTIIRPKIELSRTALLTFIIVSIPIFGVLYWYTEPHGAWQALVVAAQITLAVACSALWVRQRQVYSAVSSHAVQGNGIFSPTMVIPLANISNVTLVPVYQSHPNETNTQLVVLGNDGRCLWRLRGQFWHADDLRTITQAIGQPVVVETTPLSADEFFAEYPGSAYWFERSLAGRLVLTGGVTLLICVIVLALMVGVGVFGQFA